MSNKISAREKSLYIRCLPLIVDSIIRNGGIMRRSELAALYSSGAIEHALNARVVDKVKIRYTDPTNARPAEHIDCICVPTWDRKTKPAWLK